MFASDANTDVLHGEIHDSSNYFRVSQHSLLSRTKVHDRKSREVYS